MVTLFEAPLVTPAPAPPACSNPLDSRAGTLIAIVRRPSAYPPMLAIELVWRIIQTYYPGEAAKVSGVGWEAALPGLSTGRIVARNGAVTGDIRVGQYFVDHTTPQGFARRVLQVGHELRHIDQYRGSPTMSQDLREFLAFHWEALATELPGTGCMPHAMRRDLIDWALRYYNCLPAAQQSQFAAHRSALLARRMSVNGTHGNPSTAPPTACARQPRH